MGRSYGSSRYYHHPFSKSKKDEALLNITDRREQAEGMLDVIDKAIEELKIIQSHTRSKGYARYQRRTCTDISRLARPRNSRLVVHGILFRST